MTGELNKDRWTHSLQDLVGAAEVFAAPTSQFPSIGTHHLLLALLQNPGDAEPIVASMNVSFQDYLALTRGVADPSSSGSVVTTSGSEVTTIQPTVVPVVEHGPGFTPDLTARFTPLARAALERAVELAPGKASGVHVLAAILESRSVGTGILEMLTPVPLGEFHATAIALIRDEPLGTTGD